MNRNERFVLVCLGSSGDLEADACRMNAFIEERVREMPEQYYWLHKRFKTRPAGEANPYEP